VVLADGSQLCPACFQRRFGARGSGNSFDLSNLFGALKSLCMAGVAIGLCYGGYWFYNTQIKAELKEQDRVARQHALDELHQRQENDKREEEQRDAEVKRKIELARIEKEVNYRHELEAKASALAREESRQKALADEAKRTEALRKLFASTGSVNTGSANVPTANIGAIAVNDLLAQYTQLKRNLAAAAEVRKDDDRKLAIYTNLRTTYAIATDRLWQRCKGNVDPITRAHNLANPLATPDTELLAAAAEYQKDKKELENATTHWKAQKADMDRREKETLELTKAFEAVKKKLADLGEFPDLAPAASTPSVTAGVTPFDNPTRLAGLKTLYKKDGKTIQIISAMAIGDEWHYKDADGKPGTLAKEDVDRIEKNGE